MNDKRSVFTDALETLGTLIDEHQKRDAIHLAVEPVIAGEDLKASSDIGIGEDGRAYNTLAFCKGKHLGIVDPFLSKHDVVIEGERFWMIIYPRQITSLRHVWTHPFIDTSENIPTDFKIESIEGIENNERFLTSGASIEWMENYAHSLGDYTAVQLIKAADDYLENGNLFFGNESIINDMGYYADFLSKSFDKEFWKHYQIITGKEVPVYKQNDFFDCSC
jgi:hypothetical protein